MEDSGSVVSAGGPSDAVDLEDWSGTGRGFHVDFDEDDTIPLNIERELRPDAMSQVYETSVRGTRVTWKRTRITRRVNQHFPLDEIKVLNRISHAHITKIIGSYTQKIKGKTVIGVLLLPVAIFDLPAFYFDVEDFWSTPKPERSLPATLEALGYHGEANPRHKAAPVYSQMGCLVAAVAYLHASKIKHNDIKPSNILLSPGHIWLSGFGIATDHSELESGSFWFTTRYASPEVFAQSSRSRSADIFSLGCVVLELLVLQSVGSLKQLKDEREDWAYSYSGTSQDKIDAWMSALSEPKPLLSAVRAMLSKDPQSRPTAQELLVMFSDIERDRPHDAPSIIGGCCCLRSPLPNTSQGRFVERVGDASSRPTGSILNSSIDHNYRAYPSTLGTSRDPTGPRTGSSSMHKEIDNEDAETTYSVNTNMNDNVASYVQIFVQRLLGEFEADASPSLKLGIPSVELSEIIKCFAGKLHEESQTPFGWEASVSISTGTERIVSFLTNTEPHNSQNSDVASSVADVESIDTPPRTPPFVKAPEDLREWLQDIAHQPADDVARKFDDPDEDVLLPQLVDYEDLITNSDAYRWLLTEIRTKLQSSAASQNVKDRIGSRVRQSVMSKAASRKRSRRAPTQATSLTFNVVNWPLRAYIYSLGVELSEELWNQVLCLTGSPNEAQIVTVADYLSQTWPATGVEVGGLLLSLLCAPNGQVCSYPTTKLKKISGHFSGNICFIEAVAGPYYLSELAEQLAWLTATLRLSPPSDTIMVVTPRIASLTVNSEPAGGPVASSGICEMSVDFGHSTGVAVGANGSCWTRLFARPILVHGYPIPWRTLQSTGLEVSLPVMASLIRTNQVIRLDDRIVMKGFDKLLIATAFAKDSVVWHALVSESPGERISYFDNRTETLKWKGNELPLLRSLENARHFIGWCSQATDFCGHPNVSLNLTMSGVSSSPSSIHIDRLYIEGGFYAIGGMNMRINQKERAIKLGTDSDYPSLLAWIAIQFVAFYDIADRRAWLVDGTSALLHLVRLSLHKDENNPESTFHWVYDSSKLNESWTGLPGRIAAKETLKDWDNLNLPVYVKKQSFQNGSLVKVFSTFGDRVEKILRVLDLLVDAQIHMSAQDGIKISQTLDRRKGISGFDIMDLLVPRGLITSRMARVDSLGDGWIDLLPAAGVVSIFGNGFGDLIKPRNPNSACANWQSVPKGLDYLTASVSTLGLLREENLLQRHPSLQSAQFTPKHSWSSPNQAFEACKCTHRTTTDEHKSCDPVQFIISDSSLRTLMFKNSTPVDLATLDPAGAVIFANLGVGGRRIDTKDSNSNQPNSTLHVPAAASPASASVSVAGSMRVAASTSASTTTPSASSTAATSQSASTSTVGGNVGPSRPAGGRSSVSSKLKEKWKVLTKR